MLIIIGLLFLLPMLGAQLGMNLNIVGLLLGRAVDAVIEIILQITGNERSTETMHAIGARA